MTPFATWLAEIGLGRYDSAFVSNGIDFDVIHSLSEADLRELGLTLGDRKRLLQAIAKLDEQRSADVCHSGCRTGDRFGNSRRRGFAWRRTSPTYRDVLRSCGFDGAK